MHKKVGVTLLTLSVTIVILAILTTVTIINVVDIIPNARKSKITEEFNLIESKVKEYYLTYGNYPVLNNITYTKNELIDLNSNGRKELFEYEIAQNDDETSIFYLIDLEKLRLTTLKFGTGNTEDDVYIGSSKTGKIYYPKGISMNGKIVFSSGLLIDTNIVK